MPENPIEITSEGHLASKAVRAHLRECADCHAFAQAIDWRTTALAELYGPMAPTAAADVLARVLGEDGVSDHGRPTGGALVRRRRAAGFRVVSPVGATAVTALILVGLLGRAALPRGSAANA